MYVTASAPIPGGPSVADEQVESAGLALHDAVMLKAVFPSCLDRSGPTADRVLNTYRQNFFSRLQ